MENSIYYLKKESDEELFKKYIMDFVDTLTTTDNDTLVDIMGFYNTQLYPIDTNHKYYEFEKIKNKHKKIIDKCIKKWQNKAPTIYNLILQGYGEKNAVAENITFE